MAKGPAAASPIMKETSIATCQCGKCERLSRMERQRRHRAAGGQLQGSCTTAALYHGSTKAAAARRRGGRQRAAGRAAAPPPRRLGPTPNRPAPAKGRRLVAQRARAIDKWVGSGGTCGGMCRWSTVESWGTCAEMDMDMCRSTHALNNRRCQEVALCTHGRRRVQQLQVSHGPHPQPPVDNPCCARCELTRALQRPWVGVACALGCAGVLAYSCSRDYPQGLRV